MGSSNTKPPREILVKVIFNRRVLSNSRLTGQIVGLSTYRSSGRFRKVSGSVAGRACAKCVFSRVPEGSGRFPEVLPEGI